jgi:hypothetical protein
MLLSQHAFKRTLLLVITLLATACGTGISFDPTSVHRAPPNGAGDADTAEVSFSDDGGDASVEEDVSSSDVLDGANDSSVDRSADAESGRDASSEISAESTPDSSVDRDDAIADSGPNESSDAPKDTGREVVTADVIDGCPVGCGETVLEYYVDARAPPGGDGSKEAPFRTISAAVEAHAHAPSQARKAYIAAGTYDGALGEIFPLVLRGLSLEGAGADKTFIVGAGTFNHASEGGPKREHYIVTIVVGDRVLPTNISRLSLRPLQQVPARGYYGVFCDRGNATGEVASPAGQTHLDEISVGPGFETSVLVLTSTFPLVTGCNMLMTRSTVTGGWHGVLAVGCDGSDTPGPVILEMGTDDPTSGNTVTWMQGQNGTGVGAIVDNCVVRASFQYNTIADCSIGISVGGNTPIGSRPFQIKHNTFARMPNVGVRAAGTSVFVEEISDNRFIDSTRVPTSFQRAAGMHLSNTNVGKVRRNVFVGNDVGARLDEGAELTDFGRPGDPGGNVFFCNSGIDGWLGADVVVYYPPVVARSFSEADGGPDAGDADSPLLLPFAGNSWDHDPQRIATPDSPTNGVEISLEQAPPLVFDLSGSSVVTTPCPAGRIH